MAFDPNSPAIGHEARSDITAIKTNSNALRNCESSATEPSNLVAGMFWFDTTSNYLKLRNEANTAWQNVWDFGNNRLPLNVLAPGELAATTDGRLKMADLFVTNAKVNDVAGNKLTGNAPANFVAAGGLADGAVNTSAKISAGIVNNTNLVHNMTTGTWSVITGTGTYVLPAGFYAGYFTGTWSSFQVQCYIDGSWRTQLNSPTTYLVYIVLSDGTNTRFNYGSAGDLYFFYQKF